MISVRVILAGLVMLSCAAFVAVIPKPVGRLSDDLLKMVDHPTEYRDVQLTYTEQEMARVLPYLKLTACIFAQQAVRYSLRPAAVAFTACPHTSDFNIVFSQDLTGVTVSGVAKVDGLERPFTATLQHYPTATEIDGYQTISVTANKP